MSDRRSAETTKDRVERVESLSFTASLTRHSVPAKTWMIASLTPSFLAVE